MGRPVNSKNFGSDGSKIGIRFVDGNSIIDGYIVKQTGDRRYLVSNDTITKSVILADDAADAAIIGGAPADAATIAALDGKATIRVQDAGVTKFVKRLHSFRLALLGGGAKSWRLGDAPEGGVEIMLVQDVTIVIPAPTLPFTINNTNMTGTGEWVVASGVTQAIADFPVVAPSGRTSGLRITKGTTGTFGGVRTVNVPANFTLSSATIVGMWVYWSADQGSVSLRFTSDAFATKRREFSWAWSGQLHKGWNLLTVRPDDDGTTTPGATAWSVVGGQTLDEVINGIQISVSTASGNAAEIFVDTVFYHSVAPTQGVVMMGFDRFGEASIPQLALPILQAADMKGYWAGDANLIENPGNPLTYLQTVDAAGWLVISQGMNHPDYTVAGATQLGTDYDTARAIFAAKGFTRGLNHFSYPLSSNNAATDAMLISKGVRMARSGWAWAIHPNEFNAGPKLIGHGAVNIGGKTLAQIKKLVDMAVRLGVCIDLFCHGLTAGGTGTAPPSDALLWYADDYAALVDYITDYRAQGLLRTMTPDQYYETFQTGPTVA